MKFTVGLLLLDLPKLILRYYLYFVFLTQVKQKRRQIKEKIFQAELIAMMKQAEEFTAEKYVEDKLAKVNYTPIPTRWKGKRLPEFIIRQLMGLDKKINYKHNDVYKA